jgi:hypothetical protein
MVEIYLYSPYAFMAYRLINEEQGTVYTFSVSVTSQER